MKPCVARRHLDTCSWKVWQKSIQGKWQKWCVVHVTKNASATNFFTLSPKPIARFRRKRAVLSLFRPKPHLPSFIQIHPSIRDLLAKTTFQIVTIIGDPMPLSNIIAGKAKVLILVQLGWQFGLVVTRWSRPTKLLYVGPG